MRSEPRDWITDFEPNYLAGDRVLRRGLPLALHAGGARPRDGRGCALARAGRARGGRVRRGDDVADRPLPAIAVARRRAASRRRRVLGVGARARQPLAAAGGAATTSWTTWARCCRCCEADAAGERRPRLLAARLPSQAAREPGLPRVRRSGVRERAARGARARPVGSAGRHALGLGSVHGSGRPRSLPYYHRWYFRTGAIGDFEYLVRLLRPRPVDPRVGVREIDVLRPGANLPAIDDPALQACSRSVARCRSRARCSTSRHGTSATGSSTGPSPYPHPFQRALADLIDLADDYAAQAAASANRHPTSVPACSSTPIRSSCRRSTGAGTRAPRGSCASATATPVDPDANWVHALNLDPRHRVTAGLGTRGRAGLARRRSWTPPGRRSAM